ncbi:hypothetical protein [Leptospira johnsonii]|nr:hypothetical protein [Leptospira johnsonii]
MQDEHVISAGISMEKDYLMLNKTNPKKYNFSSEYNAIKSSIYIGIIVDDGDSDYEESYIYQVTMPRIPTQGLEPILESKTGISERVDNRISDLKNSSIVRKIDFSYPFYFLKNQKAPVAFADKFSVFIPERSHQIKLGETWERTLYRNVIGICRFPNSDEKNTEILLEAKFRFRFSGIVRLKSKIYYVIDFVREEYPEGPKGLFSTDWKAQLEKLDENIPYENAFLQREWKDVGLRSIGRIYYDLDQRSVFLSRSFGQKYEDVSSAKFFFSEDFDLDSNP